MKKNEPTLNERPQPTSAQLALADYLKKLTLGSVVQAQHCLTLPEIRKVVAAGQIVEISIATFWRPLLIEAVEWKQGKLFAHAATGEPLGLYWQVGLHKHYCRPLTWYETQRFRDLTRKSLTGASTKRRPTQTRITCRRNSNEST